MSEFKQLCVWPGTIVGDDQIEDFVKFFKENFGVTVKYELEVKTNPDISPDGSPVEGTGGRNDVLFYVASEDVSKFAIPKIQIGARWWEDVVKYNDDSYLYPQEILDKYQPQW